MDIRVSDIHTALCLHVKMVPYHSFIHYVPCIMMMIIMSSSCNLWYVCWESLSFISCVSTFRYFSLFLFFLFPVRFPVINRFSNFLLSRENSNHFVRHFLRFELILDPRCFPGNFFFSKITSPLLSLSFICFAYYLIDRSFLY